MVWTKEQDGQEVKSAKKLRSWAIFDTSDNILAVSENVANKKILVNISGLEYTLFLRKHEVPKIRMIMKHKNEIGINFINVLFTAFTHAELKSVKTTVKLSVFYAFGICVFKSFTKICW